MKKIKKDNSSLIISKTAGKGGEKILLRFTAAETLKWVLCFLLHFSRLFSSMAPFGVAFYSAVFKSEGWIAYFICSLLGCIVSGGEMLWVYVLTLISQTAVFAVFDEYMKKPLYKSIVTALLFFTLGLAKFIVTDYIVYDIMALVLETSVLAVFCTVFRYSVNAADGIKERLRISESEILCMCASIAVCTVSTYGLGIPGRLEISAILLSLLVMFCAFVSSGKTTLAASVLFGIVGAFSQGRYVIMAMYPLGALLSLLLKKYGKPGIIAGFVTAASISALFPADTKEIVMLIYNTIIACVLFALVPSRFSSSVSKLLSKVHYEETDTLRDCEVNSSYENFMNLANSLEKLSGTYMSDRRKKFLRNGYLSMMKSEVISKVCRGCANRKTCFSENGGIADGVIDFMIPGKKEKRQTLSDSGCEQLKKICRNYEEFMRECRCCAQITETEMKWLDKTNETRKLVAMQLDGIAQILKKECANSCVTKDRELEGKLWTELDKAGIRAENVKVKRDGDYSFDIEITVSRLRVNKETRETLLECVNNLSGEKFSFGGLRTAGENYVFSFYPSSSYTASFGYATIPKSGESVCGDSYNVLYTGKHKTVMVLSDGMGSGEKAMSESKTTVELLERFLTAGFECETAVKLINSTLLMQGGRESFATVDICDINLSSATVEFIKLAASDTFMKTEGKVTKIRGEGLPLGILRDTGAKKHMLPVSADTVIVMVSDGLTDIALKNPQSATWLEDELMKTESKNPQIIAGKLLKKAVKLQNGKVNDDMTVLVGYIKAEK